MCVGGLPASNAQLSATAFYMYRTGIVYDPIYLKHDTDDHVERAQRLVEIHRALDSSGIIKQLVNIPARPATMQELHLVHSPDYVKYVRGFGSGWLDPDTYMSPDSYNVALHAAGGAIEATKWIVGGKVDSVFALVRPPGHHASANRAAGFCIFNNAALAARKAVKDLKLSRVMIVDYDVHHGNGTQDIFYEDPSVLYFSTHQYPHYPGTGSYNETGAGDAKGTKINVPLPAFCGDEEYLQVFQEILVPSAKRYRPELVLVSAGYDAHWMDMLAQMQLTVSGYHRMSAILKDLATQLCQGRILVILEGGYALQAIAASVQATFEVLLGKPETGDPLGPPPERRKPHGFEDLLFRVKKTHNLE